MWIQTRTKYNGPPDETNLRYPRGISKQQIPHFNFSRFREGLRFLLETSHPKPITKI